jgi:hypothetical protein
MKILIILLLLCFASKIIMLQEALQFHFTIMLRYSKHITMGVIN